MEPVTHLLTGAVLARAGLNRKAAYATAAMVIAAELPDLDTLWGFAGPITGFEHHRGITHTFVAMPFEAAAVTAAFWAWHRLRGRPKTTAAAHWAWLYAGCLVALLSHLLLDWTNNYGVRPFFPFNPRWYAGSFVFIIEPVLYVLLGAALVMPALFGLVGSEIGARRTPFRGRGWAIAALCGMALLYGFRSMQKAEAIRLAAAEGPADATRLFASPHPGNPFAWHVVTDSPGSYRLLTVDTRRGIVLPGQPSDTLYKPEPTLALMAAKRTYLGRIYLDWSMFPVLSETPVADDPQRPMTQVMFSDARFLYDASFLRGRTSPPLAATVTLDMQASEGQRVEQMKMGGREQR